MVKRGGIGHISSGVIGYNGNVVAHFVLIWVPEKWIELLTDGHVCRPGMASVIAIRIEQLRVRIIRRVTRVEPNNIDASIRSHRKSAKPMPFGPIWGIIVDSDRRAKGLPAISASNKHHISSASRSGGADTGEHVDIVVGAGARAIDCQEHLAGQSTRIDRVARTNKTTQIDRGGLVKRRHDGSVLRVN